MTPTTNLLSATQPKERILSLDVLRGIAVLGILIMNVQSFSMIMAAYINPTAYGDLTGINKWVWVISHTLADQKFMSIFSILFGAGVILFIERALAKNNKAGRLHYWRNFLLLIFGLMHAYLIWYGDILVAYALCGFFVYLFRKKRPVNLLIISGISFIIPVLIYLMMGASIQHWPEASYKSTLESWLPSMEKINHEISMMQGSWSEQMEIRVPSSIFMQTALFFMQVFWRVTSMMLLGMALYKSGVLSAERSKKFYVKMAVIGLVIGYAIVGLGVCKNFEMNWLMDYSMFVGSQFNYVGSVAIALGYISLVMLICKSEGFKRFKALFAKAGKMAFSNYILMSIIGLLLFTGTGLGLYGEVDRLTQLFFVIGIWVFVLILSHFWLKYFKFGPIEWLWRSLTYRKRQPFRV